MRTSRWLVAGLALCLVLAFQNCSETLPAQQEKSLSSANPDAPLITLNSLTAGPSAVLPGSSISLNAKLASNQNLTDATLKLTVKDAAQVIVWTQDFSGQTLSSGSINSLVQTFVSLEAQRPGLYTVSADLTTSKGEKTSFPNATTFEIKPPVRVSVGNTMPYTDTMGRVWAGDFGFTGVSVPTTEVLNSVQGTNDPMLYSSFRYGQDPNTGGSAAFTFTTAVPSQGKYKVTLKWVEHYVFAPGKRIFSVSINGQTVLQDFDLFVAAGGAFIAYDRSFIVTASQVTPQIQVTFLPGSIENPKINAIEVFGAY